MTEDFSNFKQEFVDFASGIADKIIDVYTHATIPDNIKKAAGDSDILKICISMSIQRWQTRMSSVLDSFKSDMNNETFMKDVAEQFNKGESK